MPAVANVEVALLTSKAQANAKALRAETLKLNTGLKNTAVSAGVAKKGVLGLGASLAKVMAPIVAVTAAVGVVTGSFKRMADREKDIKVLRNGLKGLVTDSESAAKVLQKSADKLGNTTLFSQDQFNEGFKLLTSFRSIAVSSYDRIAQAAADVAEVSGTDVNQAFMQLAKAIDLPEKNLANLSRSGIIFTDAQKDLIIKLKESGDAMGAQAKILEIIEGQYAGAAQAAGGGFAGALDLLGENFADFQETLGKDLAPTFVPLIEGLAKIVGSEKFVIALSNAFKTLIFPLSAAAKFIQGLGEGLKESLGPEKIEAISNAFMGFHDAVSRGFVLFEKFAVIVGRLVGNLPAIFAPAVENLKNIWIGISDVATGAATKIVEVYTGVSDAIKGIAEGIGGFFSKAFDTLKERINSFYESLPDWMKKALDFMMGKAKAVANVVGEKVGGVVGGVTDAVTGAAGNVRDTVTNTFDAAKGLVIDTDALDKALSSANVDAAKAISEYLAKPETSENSLDKITDKVSKNVKETTSLTDKLKEAFESVKETIASGLHSAVMGLIDGTKSLGESLAGIAKQIASLMLKKAIFGAFGLKAAEGAYVANGIKPFASGGMVTKPTMGLVGEAGEDEYIIPASKMAQSMQRYSSGARGESVIPGTGQSSAGGGADAQTTVNYSGPILNFNSEEFVPKSAIGEIINSAAARGAKAGEARTLSSLQNSRSRRQGIGL